MSNIELFRKYNNKEDSKDNLVIAIDKTDNNQLGYIKLMADKHFTFVTMKDIMNFRILSDKEFNDNFMIVRILDSKLNILF